MVIGPVLCTPLWGFLPEQLREKPQQEEEGATFINISSAAELAGRQPAMRHCSEDPHLCWTSWLLGFISLLLKCPCIYWQNTKKKGPLPSLTSRESHGDGGDSAKGIRGGSVLFHVIKKQEAEPEEVAWAFGPESNYRVLLRVHRGADTPTWVNLQDKYQQRVHVPNNLSLKIENLTCEDSGHYRARVSFPGGIELIQVFLLTVYEPVPFPQILMGSASITPDRCNVTLECRASGATEDLNVTWENKGLPEEWEQRRTLEPASNSRILAVSLPTDQSNVSLVCVVSNPVGNKTASFDLGKVCVHVLPAAIRCWQLPGAAISQMWYPSFLEYCAHLEYLGNCYSSLKVQDHKMMMMTIAASMQS
ncbi:SLAM family member 5-like isoform X7 [Cervus elaphus]|uniref:SLAM family member 5-like isoform X7 n=1 Tax=Cervus elaphus TaxID=9860 RepID=UPI001CC29F0F|nr:SLAM family member 5-like isoform X7 [Cervus elaphus]